MAGSERFNQRHSGRPDREEVGVPVEKGCNKGAMGSQKVDWRFHQLDPVSIDPRQGLCSIKKKIGHLKDKT